MNTTRLLLPFTHGVNILALEYAIMLAKSSNATLVPLSLIPLPPENHSKGVRLEHIQQSQDFLVAIQQKAAKHSVPVEPIEQYTNNPIETINNLANDMDCQSVLLFVRDKEGILLPLNEIKHLMTTVPSNYHVFHLPSTKTYYPLQLVLKRFFTLLPSQRKPATSAQT